MPTLTPPLKWHGGKNAFNGKLANWIISLMPRHLCYVEPYFGGGAVLLNRDPGDRRLWWDQRTSDGREPDGVAEVVNDLNSDLMNFYTVLRDLDLFGRLRHRLELTLLSEAEWQQAGEHLAGAGGDSVERAAALFVLCRQSRAALMKDFATTTRTRLRGGREDGVNGWWGAVEGLADVHRRLRDVKVLCRPALDVIRTHDGPAVCFYLDPPYLHESRAATKAYGRYEMTDGDHRDLLAVLRCVKGKVLLSGYASDLYDRALADWNRHTFEIANNAAGGKQKDRETEVLWCNF
jgi:DNA adenine methylase